MAWTAEDALHPRARLTVAGETATLALAIDEGGCTKSGSLPRWGNPEGAPFRYVDFGAVVEREDRFGGFTIPARLRVGYYVGTDRFDEDGEFFRATIDEAAYR